MKALPAVATALAASWIPAEAQQEVERRDRIEVTGSRLATSSDLDSSSPIAIIDAKDIQLEGYQSVELILNNYPQFVPHQGNRISAGATGTATANLRGMGPGRTLVLVNGKRMPAGSPFVLSPDLNQVPPQLIKRVEVLTGGASAVYGSDAIAGVVNFILNDRFEGVQGNVSYDFYNHQQKNGMAQEMLREAGQPIPGDKSMDGGTGGVDLTFGANFPRDKGNAVASIRYYKSKALLQSERDYSACPLRFPADQVIPVADGGNVPHCLGLGAKYLVWDLRWFYPGFDEYFMAPLPLTRDPVTGQLREYRYTDQFNSSPMTYFQRPQERYLTNAFATYELTPLAKVYAEFGFHDDRSVAQIDPVFAVRELATRYENPFLTADYRSALVFRNPDGSLGSGPGTVAQLLIGSRNHEAPPRQDRLYHKSFRQVIGLKGQGAGWDYDAYFQDARVKYRNEYVNDFSFSRVTRALDVVPDPATGAAACRSALDGTDRNCAPYNAWNGTMSPAALAYVLTSASQQATMSQRILGGTVRANLADYGISLPQTREAAEIAVGFERRTEKLDFEPGDFADLEGYNLNPFSPPKAVNGGFTVMDLFAELRVPVVDLLTLTGTYRRSDYDRGVVANTYGVGLNTAPFRSTRLRASYQRVIRAPNLNELFQPQTGGSLPWRKGIRARGPRPPDRLPTASVPA
jgi:outer membrane receptor protein involved in Fe transport